MPSIDNSPPEPEYQPQSFWENRLSSAKLDVDLVGHSGLGLIYNRWLYRTRFSALNRGLKRLGIRPQGKSIIDVGVGSGAYIPFWQESGTKNITGLDITTSSVRTLQHTYSDLRFDQIDIAGDMLAVQNGPFDIVTAFDVLFHIVDDKSFSRAIGNLASLAQPGGWVILSDSFCQHPWGPTFHEYHRSAGRYLAELKTNHLELVHQEPIFFTMTTVLCLQEYFFFRVLQASTAITLKLVRRIARGRRTEWANHAIGAPLYLLDKSIGKISNKGPSLKYWFCRKLT
jgi:2-polyprenyl-3-methyl-5-hydroxy-6-metoxy-1,4-benzoquinol methylase